VRYTNVGICIWYSTTTAHSCVPGYRWLFEHARILHRDFSLDNPMLWTKDDKVYGVLNDMDLTISMQVMNLSSKQCMSTKPFMAIDLLRPDRPVHMYCHDLESMFYVLVSSCPSLHEQHWNLIHWTSYAGQDWIGTQSSMYIVTHLFIVLSSTITFCPLTCLHHADIESFLCRI
jgi:hypothetical protein